MEETGRCVRVVDLDAIRDNVRAIRRDVPVSARLMAVVKADAYGHGARQVARAALSAGATQLAVAPPEEGAELRESGVEAPILVLGLTDGSGMLLAAKEGLTLTVCAPEQIREAQRAAESVGGGLSVHLKFDTGMGRIGARTAEEVQSCLETLETCRRVRLTGAFSHFADADAPELTFAWLQFQRFRELAGYMPDGVIRHCANSAAIHRMMPETAMGMVRMGISLYGCPPVETDCPLRPCMRWTAAVTCVKEIGDGESVSYGRTWRAEGNRRIATIACGYGDGYHRAAGGRAEVLLHGRRAKIVGRICMDQMMADVTDIPDVRAGDRAVLLGEDGSGRITADELAGWAGTISYEILLAAANRVERRFLHE